MNTLIALDFTLSFDKRYQLHNALFEQYEFG